MKSLQLLSNVFSFVFLISIFIFVGCGDSDIEGCTSDFATNYDASATINCCCEYNNIESKINEFVGPYEYKQKASGPIIGDPFSQILIAKEPGNKIGITVKGDWFRDMSGSFVNGVFTLKSNVRTSIFGCYDQTKGKIYFEENSFIMEMEYRGWGTPLPPKDSSCASLNTDRKGELTKL